MDTIETGNANVAVKGGNESLSSCIKIGISEKKIFGETVTSKEYGVEAFNIKEYEMSPECKGRRLTDKLGIRSNGIPIAPPIYELWIDGKWKRVNEGVFLMWLAAYEAGKSFVEKITVQSTQ